MLAQKFRAAPERGSSTSLAVSTSGPLDSIANSARTLLIPSASLYFECNQERIRQHQLQVAALDLQLEAVRKRAFAAAVKLMALAGPTPSEAKQPDRNSGEAFVMSGAFTERERMQFAAIEQQVTRAALGAVPLAGVTILLSVCASLSGGVEYAISYELFAYFKAPLPGEESQWSVALLALTGVLMALALHLHASEHPDSFAVRILRQSVSVLVPLYALGAGLALAAILYFDGADALFNANETLELFATAAEQSGSSLIAALISNFALIFVLGCGGLAIINLYIFHKLLCLITANTASVSARVLAAREAREAMQEIHTNDQHYAELSSQREALIAENPRSSEFAFASHIVSVWT